MKNNAILGLSIVASRDKYKTEKKKNPSKVIKYLNLGLKTILFFNSLFPYLYLYDIK